MGRYPIGDRAMTNAEKQSNYRKRLEEKEKERAINGMNVSTQLVNSFAKIRQLEYLLKENEKELEEMERLKKDNEDLHADNIILKRQQFVIAHMYKLDKNDRNRLIKLLGMLGSEYEGERSNATAQIERLYEKIDKSLK